MSDKSTDAEKIVPAIKLIAKEYKDLTISEVSDIAEKIGKEACKRVRAASPVSDRMTSGQYKRSWKSKLEDHGTSVRVVIYNAKYYRLVHLLEHGHKTILGRSKNGKRYGAKARTAAQAHIAPVNGWAQAEFERRIKAALEDKKA